MEVDRPDTLPVFRVDSSADSLLQCHETLDDRSPLDSPPCFLDGALEDPPSPSSAPQIRSEAEPQQQVESILPSDPPATPMLLPPEPAESSHDGCSDDFELESPKCSSPPVKSRSIWDSWTTSESQLFRPTHKFMPTGVGAGLVNLGLTCFINAVLQCFTHSVPLVQSLRSWKHVNPCDRAGDGFCVLCVLREHIELSLSHSGRAIAPSSLVDNLKQISTYFQRNQQEDAHEFQQALLDKLEGCSLNPKSEDSDSQPKANIVDQVFGGRLVSRLQCCNCGHNSYTRETMIDLSLEIEHVDTLSAALESFTNVEKMEDPDCKFKCENCKEEVAIEKQLLVEQEPTVAALHLKRFKSDGLRVEKIDKHVSFPLGLDLQPFTSGNTNNDMGSKYELYAIVVHTGLLPTCGHYFSFIRSSPGVWHKFDDERVRQVEEDFVLSQDAYILFYAKQGTPWFSTLMEVQHLEGYSPKSVLDKVDTPCSAKSDIDGKSFEEAVCVPLPISSPLSSRSYEKPIIENNNVDDGPKQYTTFSIKDITMEDEVEMEDVFHPLTPPSSPPSETPDTLHGSKQLSEPTNRNVKKHQKPKTSISRRQLNEALEDSQRKEALKCMKGMPKSRAAQLLNAMLNPTSNISKKHTGKRSSGGRVRPMVAANVSSRY